MHKKDDKNIFIPAFLPCRTVNGLSSLLLQRHAL